MSTKVITGKAGFLTECQTSCSHCPSSCRHDLSPGTTGWWSPLMPESVCINCSGKCSSMRPFEELFVKKLFGVLYRFIFISFDLIMEFVSLLFWPESLWMFFWLFFIQLTIHLVYGYMIFHIKIKFLCVSIFMSIWFEVSIRTSDLYLFIIWSSQITPSTPLISLSL